MPGPSRLTWVKLSTTKLRSGLVEAGVEPSQRMPPPVIAEVVSPPKPSALSARFCGSYATELSIVESLKLVQF